MLWNITVMDRIAIFLDYKTLCHGVMIKFEFVSWAVTLMIWLMM